MVEVPEVFRLLDDDDLGRLTALASPLSSMTRELWHYFTICGIF
jgi:hypothetical protein